MVVPKTLNAEAQGIQGDKRSSGRERTEEREYRRWKKKEWLHDLVRMLLCRLSSSFALYSSLSLARSFSRCLSLRAPLREVIRRFWRVISRNAIYADEISSITPRLLIYWQGSKANALLDIYIFNDGSCSCRSMNDFWGTAGCSTGR